MNDIVQINVRSACGRKFEIEQVMNTDGTMNLLVDIAEPISIPKGGSRRLPTPIHLKGNGHSIALMHVLAGRTVEQQNERQGVGQFLIPSMEQEDLVEVLVINETGGPLMILPNYSLGTLTMVSQEQAGAPVEQHHDEDEYFDIVAVYKPSHLDDSHRPAYATSGAAGMDLRADIEDAITLAPGARTLIRTGLSMEIPAGFEGQIRPRSGLALKHGISVTNSPATIDSDYRGDIGVILHNLGDEPFVVGRGDRIAQFIIAPVMTAKLDFRDALDQSERGAGGFGSTGRQ